MGLFSVLLFFVGYISFFKNARYITIITILILSSQYFGMVEQTFSLGPLSLQYGDLSLLLICSILLIGGIKISDSYLYVKKIFIIFILFLIVSMFFDYLYRDTSLVQIFRTTRKLGYLGLIFLLGSFSEKDYRIVFKVIGFLTIIHSCIYILQYMFDYPAILFNGVGIGYDSLRYGNWPVFILPISIYLLFSKKGVIRYFYLIVFYLVVILAQGRGMIIAFSVVVFMLLIYEKRSLIVSSFISIVFFVSAYIIVDLFYPVVLYRFNDMINQFHEMPYNDYENLIDLYHQGSAIFRWGLTYERIAYIIEDPIKILLGVGYIPDMDLRDPVFILGTNSPLLRVGYEQYNSVDIFFPNIITRYGFLGSVIFIGLLYKIYHYSYINKTLKNGYMLYVYLIAMIFMSFVNETFYNGFNFLFVYLFMGLVDNEKEYIKNVGDQDRKSIGEYSEHSAELGLKVNMS